MVVKSCRCLLKLPPDRGSYSRVCLGQNEPQAQAVLSKDVLVALTCNHAFRRTVTLRFALGELNT
jgi:hypothetical protein